MTAGGRSVCGLAYVHPGALALSSLGFPLGPPSLCLTESQGPITVFTLSVKQTLSRAGRFLARHGLVCRVVPRPCGEPVGTGDVGQMAGSPSCVKGAFASRRCRLRGSSGVWGEAARLRRRVIGLSMLPSLARVGAGHSGFMTFLLPLLSPHNELVA